LSLARIAGGFRDFVTNWFRFRRVCSAICVESLGDAWRVLELLGQIEAAAKRRYKSGGHFTIAI